MAEEEKTSLDKQLEKAMERSDIRKAYAGFKGEPSIFKKTLRNYIERENAKNHNLKRLAKTVDVANKASIPYDAVTDYFTIMGGVGFAAKAIKDLLFLPGYLAYNAYYVGKTGKIWDGLKNVGYEALSWFSLGGFPHLFSHYAKQADKYSTEQASKNFLKSLEHGGLEKIISLPDEKKGQLKEGSRLAA